MKSTLLKMKKLIFIVIALVIAAVSVFFAIDEDARQKETVCRIFGLQNQIFPTFRCRFTMCRPMKMPSIPGAYRDRKQNIV